MGRLLSFASRRPLIFVILLILSSLIIVSLAASLVVVLFGVDQTDPILGLVGNLTAILYLLIVLSRFGWLKAAGIASGGHWKGWTAALLLLAYYLLELSYSFFGDFSFYKIVDREGIRVDVSNEATVASSSAFEKNLTFIRVEERTDGELTLTQAIRSATGY